MGESAAAVASPFAAGLAADAAVAAVPAAEGAGLVAREGKLSSSRLGGACGHAQHETQDHQTTHVEHTTLL